MAFRIKYRPEIRAHTTIYKDREMYVGLVDAHTTWDYRGKDLGFIDDHVWDEAIPISEENVAKILLENGLF